VDYHLTSVWLSLVVILLNTLNNVFSERIQFSSPDLTHSHGQLVDAFVDDTSIGFTLDGNHSYKTMIDWIKQIAQTWENLLHLYVLYWDWEQDRPTLRHSSEEDPTVILRQSETNKSITITRTSPDETTRMLGVHLSQVGNFSKHLSILKTKMDSYSVSLRSPKVSHSDVKVFHRAIYKPAVRYSLPAVASYTKAIQKLQSKVIPTILQRLGFTSKLPTRSRGTGRSRTYGHQHGVGNWKNQVLQTCNLLSVRSRQTTPYQCPNFATGSRHCTPAA
jgi:hypothetical protein